MTDVAKTVYLASYKGTRSGVHGLLNRFIRWSTNGPYSHSEVCVGHPFEAPVLCVSSVGSEGGVRGKVMQLSPDKWDLVPMHHVAPKAVDDFLRAHAGEGYDVLGAVRTVLPFVSGEHPTKWFCTEIAAFLSGQSDAWRFHPTLFHRVCERILYTVNWFAVA